MQNVRVLVILLLLMFSSNALAAIHCFTWNTPNTRENGDPMAVDELDFYEILGKRTMPVSSKNSSSSKSSSSVRSTSSSTFTSSSFPSWYDQKTVWTFIVTDNRATSWYGSIPDELKIEDFYIAVSDKNGLYSKFIKIEDKRNDPNVIRSGVCGRPDKVVNLRLVTRSSSSSSSR